jgi:hypothetical protein
MALRHIPVTVTMCSLLCNGHPALLALSHESLAQHFTPIFTKWSGWVKVKGITEGSLGDVLTLQIRDLHWCAEDHIRVKEYKRDTIQHSHRKAAWFELVLVAYLTEIVVYILLVLQNTCMCSFNKGWVYCYGLRFHVDWGSIWHRMC